MIAISRPVSQHMSTAGRPNGTDHCHAPLVSTAAIPDTAAPTVTIPDNRYGPLTDHGARRAVDTPGTIERHERGILGEFAAAKLFGVPDRVDTTIYEYGDPGYDFTLGGWTVDVKTAHTRHNTPALMVDAETDVTADFYVLVHQLSQRCYRILGYAPGAVVAEAPVRRLSVHRADRMRVVEQDRLFPVWPQLARSLDGRRR